VKWPASPATRQAADKRRRAVSRLLALAVLNAGFIAVACAGPGELTVLTVAPMQGAFASVLNQYERETGRHVALIVSTPARLAAALKGADAPDLVVLADDDLTPLAISSHLLARSRTAFVRDGLGVAVKQGAASPDLSTPASFRQALVDARTLGYADPSESASGRQVVELVAGFKLVDALKSKTSFGTGISALAPIAFGDVSLGLYPVSQIIATPGVRLVGPLPAELQRWTRYDIALAADPPNLSEARELLRYLSGPGTHAGLRAKGFEPTPP